MNDGFNASHLRMVNPTELLDLAAKSADREAVNPWDTPAVVLDLNVQEPEFDSNTIAELKAWAAAAPAVILGFGPVMHRLGGLCDLTVDSLRDLRPVIGNIVNSPIAALTLVQTLRLGSSLSAIEALTLESLAYATLQAGGEFKRWSQTRNISTPSERVHAQPAVILQRDAECLSLILNRPDRRNSLSVEMRDALVQALDLARADSSILRIRVEALGSCFSSGGDLIEFGTRTDPASAHAVRSVRNPARQFLMCADRLHVHVHGHCVGAGIELAAFATNLIARHDTWFRLPEIQMGLIPGSGGTVSLPRRIGRQRAAFMALSGLPIDAATALSWGLIDAVED
jgi:hypothetical protein